MIEESSLKKLQSKEMKILEPANDKHSAKILKMVRDELAKLVRKMLSLDLNLYFLPPTTSTLRNIFESIFIFI